MTTKMKGLLKGLRCISQIFEPNDKEEEMQIGCPTDVKHVAHIGWDGPTVNRPAWMSGFKQVPELASAPPSTTGESKGQLSPTKRTSEGPRSGCSGTEDSLNRDLPELPKLSRRHQNQENPNDEQSDAPKTTRRGQSISNSATREASDAPKQRRRHSHKSSSSGMGSPTKESSTSKNTRRKKSSRSGDGGSTRSSRSRDLGAAYSDPDVNDAREQVPTTKPKDRQI
ncbi:hypothetical protein AAC387_Pa12g1626 [Persea americana]